MRQTTPTPIDDLAAPEPEELTLVWPSSAEILRMVGENRRQRESWTFDLLGIPCSAWLGAYGQGPVSIMTGHQPAFFHPGVWAKNVAVAKIARAIGGEARFLIVDSDAPGREVLSWPEGHPGGMTIGRSLAPAGTEHLSYEQTDAWSDLACADVFSRASTALRNSLARPRGEGKDQLLPCFVEAFLTSETVADKSAHRPSYIDRWIAAMRATEDELGIESPAYHRVSDYFSPEASQAPVSGLTFAGHLIQHASEFAEAHNESLRDYRRQRGIRGTRHPIPDLGIEENRVELPFWIVRATQPRARLWVSVPSRPEASCETGDADEVRLYADSACVASLSLRDLREHSKEADRILAEALGEGSIRPRALALTLYARLFLSDLFVHGIGGAKYDQFTDEIIRRFFGITPPAYACVSATMLLPLAHGETVSASDLRAAIRHQRDVRWNPQRHIPAHPAEQPAIVRLVTERAAAVTESLRLKRDDPSNVRARREAYRRIHRVTAAIVRSQESVRHAAELETQRIGEALREQSIAESREWFFALYPRAQLERLRDAIEFQGP